jgi:hypothetical protein
MSRARDPEQCLKLVADLADSDATIGYNFLLIFNPITEKILTFFRRHQSVGLRYMRSLSEKNRESRRNDRNLKFMEPIQYQESIHSLALLLALLCEAKALDRPVLETIFPEGLVVVGESQLYDAPSSDYDAVPDGQFYGTLTGGRFRADVMTNFKRFDHLGLPTVPRKVIELRGEADGEAFEIVADYQRGRESLTINREPIDLPVFEPYQFIWQQVLSDEQTGPRIRTDEHLAALTYRLSAALWSASYTGNELMLDSDAALIAQSFTYRDAFNQGRLPQYRRRSGLEWVERHMIDPVVDVAEGIRGRLERR